MTLLEEPLSGIITAVKYFVLVAAQETEPSKYSRSISPAEASISSISSPNSVNALAYCISSFRYLSVDKSGVSQKTEYLLSIVEPANPATSSLRVKSYFSALNRKVLRIIEPLFN